MLSFYFLLVAILWHLIPDKGTVGLIAATGLPWVLPKLIELFGVKELHLPGGVKMSFESKINTATQVLETTPLLENKSQNSIKGVPFFEQLLDQDHNIAVVAARIEIERKLREMATANQIHFDRPISVRGLTQKLNKENLLSHSEAAGLADIISTMNEAAHGTEIGVNAARKTIELSKSIVEGLERRLNKTPPEIGI